jgi:hypothetical protein
MAFMQKPTASRKVAFLADYLPRKCGIATFTTDLRCAVATEFPAMQCLVVPVNDRAGGYDYPAEVRFEIAEQDLASYLRAADFLNITDVDVVCVEHEVLGQTHPHLLRDEGEAYRLSLERLAKDLGVQRHVVFFDRFVEPNELTGFIGAADIYLTPYLTESQITSGTLAYAFGAGNAVVSTPYWHAAELLANERGKLVPFGDPAAIARAVVALLRDDPLCHAMRKNAYQLGRDMVWSRVAQLYARSFEQAQQDHSFVGRKSSPIKTLDEQPGQLPGLELDHLFRMSDSTGIFQHASFTVPNFAEGYCTDDNARALVLAVMLQKLGHGSNGFYRRGQERARFDQQPIEAQVTVSACIEAYHATADMAWVAEARRAFEWFLGRNDLGRALYDSSTGGCRDGLHVDRVSENQGAESTLGFLLALAEMQALQDTLTSFRGSLGK